MCIPGRGVGENVRDGCAAKVLADRYKCCSTMRALFEVSFWDRAGEFLRRHALFLER